MPRVNQQSLTLDPIATQSLQYFGELVGKKPHVSKAILKKNPHLTVTMLTEVMGNIIQKKPTEAATPIKSQEHRHHIQTHNIPLIKFVEDFNGDLSGNTESEIYLDRKYYSPRDVFKLKNDQHLFVTREPQMIAPNRWKYYVRMWGNSSAERVNSNFTTRGQDTQYISNYHPELSERGYDKFVFNVEEHVNYISLHRHGTSRSQLWQLTKEHVYKYNNQLFRMDDDEKRLMDLFYMSRDRALTFGKTTMDLNGKCTKQDEEGRDLIAGDGIYEQYKRYATDDYYTVLTRDMLDDAIASVVSKCPDKVGNKIMCATGFEGYQNVGRLLEKIVGSKNENGYFVTKKGEKIRVGAEFSSYTFQGNELIFTCNKAYDLELSEKDSDGKNLKSQEFLFFDITSRPGEFNKETGRNDMDAAINMITLDGASLITGNLRGMGGMSGKESGDIATTVAGSRYEVLGYAGVVVQDPSTAHILKKLAN